MKVTAQPGDQCRARESLVGLRLSSLPSGQAGSSLCSSSRLATFFLSDSSEGGAVVLPVLGGSALDASVSTTADLIVVAVVPAVAQLFCPCRSRRSWLPGLLRRAGC